MIAKDDLVSRIKMLESLARIARHASKHEILDGNILADHFDIVDQAKEYEETFGIDLDKSSYYWREHYKKEQTI